MSSLQKEQYTKGCSIGYKYPHLHTHTHIRTHTHIIYKRCYSHPHIGFASCGQNNWLMETFILPMLLEGQKTMYGLYHWCLKSSVIELPKVFSQSFIFQPGQIRSQRSRCFRSGPYLVKLLTQCTG